MRNCIYLLGPLLHIGGVVEVEVDPSNFSWWERGRVGVEVRCTVYFVGPPPHFGGMVELEVYPSNFSWMRRGREVW